MLTPTVVNRFIDALDCCPWSASVGRRTRAVVAEGKAKGGEPGWVSRQQMLPELAHAANALQAGQVSQPIKIEKGFVVLKLDGVRYPKDEKVRAQAAAQSLAEQQFKAVPADYASKMTPAFPAPTPA